MEPQHIAAALLAGPFRWKDDCEPNRLNRTPDGIPFVEFRILTSEARWDCALGTSHQAVAYGPAAIRIATTFTADDFAAVSGELCTVPGYGWPSTLLNVKNALRVPGTPPRSKEPTLNVAYVEGPVLDGTATWLRDGTPITVLTVVCQSPQPGQHRNLQTVALVGAARDLVGLVGTGDTIRADGALELQHVGRESFWAIESSHLRVIERCREPVPLVLRSVDRPFQRTG